VKHLRRGGRTGVKFAAGSARLFASDRRSIPCVVIHVDLYSKTRYSSRFKNHFREHGLFASPSAIAKSNRDAEQAVEQITSAGIPDLAESQNSRIALELHPYFLGNHRIGGQGLYEPTHIIFKHTIILLLILR
jgi:hypothetical protein